MDKGIRAHHDRRIKAKTLKKMIINRTVLYVPSLRDVGRQASKHMTCSCSICRGGRQDRINQKLHAQSFLREVAIYSEGSGYA